MSVVLPAPFGPTIAVTRPRRDLEIEAAQHVQRAEALRESA